MHKGILYLTIKACILVVLSAWRCLESIDLVGVELKHILLYSYTTYSFTMVTCITLKYDTSLPCCFIHVLLPVFSSACA